MAPRTSRSFSESWPQLFAEQGWSRRRVALELGVDPGFFSKALRGKDYKRIKPEWIREISVLAGLDGAHFPEVREHEVIEAVRADEKLRDRLFDELGLS